MFYLFFKCLSCLISSVYYGRLPGNNCWCTSSGSYTTV